MTASTARPVNKDPATEAAAMAPRVRPAALRTRVANLLESAVRAAEAAGQVAGPIMLFRAAPVWDGTPTFEVGDRTVRVVACVSPLAVMEQIALHLGRPLQRDAGERDAGEGGAGQEPDGSVLVLLSDRDGSELGQGVLSQVFGHRAETVDLWTVVADSFGALRVDARLLAEEWAVEALVDAMPPGGWPRLSGSVLGRDAALRFLAARRLGLGQLGLGPDGLDASALLQWSALDGTVRALETLRSQEREGLVGWLEEQTGPVAEALFSLVRAGRGADALPLGLVCGALWSDEASGAQVERAKGRVDLHLGDAHLDDAKVRAFATAAQDVVRTLLTSPKTTVRAESDSTRAEDHGRAGDQVPAEDQTTAATSEDADDGGHPLRRVDAIWVLDRADELVAQLGAQVAAGYSDVLRSGFDDRIGVVAGALRGCLDDPGAAASAALAGAVDRLGAHLLAQPHVSPFYADRVARTRMAQRLVRWLGEPSGPASTVGEGVDGQLAEWGWVDYALDYVRAGEATNSELQAVYSDIYGRVRARRRPLDEAFARRLADWTAAGSVTGARPAHGHPGQGLLLIESVLDRVVAPLVLRQHARNDGRPALLVVVDGMSAAVAVELADQLRDERWEEYDPLAGTGPEAVPRRRAVVAALPTVTQVSRASLLAGALRTGDQGAELAAFEQHPRWRGNKVRLFHQAAARGGPGALLAEELEGALSDLDTLVAVVINTVDDSLDHGRERAGAGWRVEDVGLLRTLLDHARYHGRAVILTSDHGHVPDRDGNQTRAADAESARHRAGTGPAGAGEVELAGSRVLAPGNRVVALWDPDARYLPRRAGYHGGASLAEVTVPLLAFLPLGAGAPDGWKALTDQHPAWWSARPAVSAAPSPGPAAAGQTATAPAAGASRGRRPAAGKAAAAAGQAALDLGMDSDKAAPAAVTGPEDLVDSLLRSEMFKAQHRLTPRKVPEPKIRKAIGALLDAGGVLPVVVVAERAGEHPARAVGFMTTLLRITNVDNYPVLSMEDGNRTVRLNEQLLREQFELGGDGA